MNFKNKKGITLVALVITIIVLLILAGVALSLVLGENGITERAVNAGKTQNIAGAKEKLELEVANLAGEYYQAKYVNNNVSENTVGEYILAKLAERYPSNTEFCDGYKLEVTGSTVKLTSQIGSDDTSVEGTITDNGKITFDPIVIASSSGTSTNTSTNTTSNTTSNTTENTTGGGSGSITSLSFVDANSNGQADVGEAVEYNITYTDVYTNYGFTASDGWRLLSIEDETGKTTKTIKLISTGIPAKLYYKYDSTSNNGWWGTTGNTNVKAAYGLENNFESISFAAGNTAAENSGCFTNINGTTTGNLTGAAFKIAGDNVSVHNLTLGELNAARNLAASSTTSTATTDGATGLFYLRNLATNYNYTTSTNCYYWLASPNTSDAIGLYYVSDNGYFHSLGSDTIGVRPVVSISGVTIE